MGGRRCASVCPPGYCWDELGRMEMDPDERVQDAVRMVFRNFRELGSARQVLLWELDSDVKWPVVGRGPTGSRIEWRRPAHHNVLTMIRNPIYGGAYVFGSTKSSPTLITFADGECPIPSPNLIQNRGVPIDLCGCSESDRQSGETETRGGSSGSRSRPRAALSTPGCPTTGAPRGGPASPARPGRPR
jgi:hypothetical protein